MKVFDEMNRQFGLDQAAKGVARELRESGFLDQVLGTDDTLDVYLKPEGQDDGFFSLICALGLKQADITPAVAGMLVSLVNERFTEQLARRLDPRDVENIQGYVLDCEIVINGNTWVGDV